MAAGAVATAAGFKLVIGRARFEYEVFSRVPPNRLIGLVVLAGPWRSAGR